MTDLLEIQGLVRRFGGLIAVDDVSMKIEVGEVRGLIGPNGAGKTTMLNMIGGVIQPSAGVINFLNRNITGLRSDMRAALGVRRTFQNIKLFPEMSVLDNVKVGCHTLGRSEIFDSIFRTARHRGEEANFTDLSLDALDRVGMRGYAAQQAGSLAYGHRRLLEIARALVAKPKLLLLDEPAAGLNRTEASELVILMRKIAEDGIAIVLVEHHMDVVMQACDTITVLNYGKLLKEGNPREIQKDAQVIAAYLGSDEGEFGEKHAQG